MDRKKIQIIEIEEKLKIFYRRDGREEMLSNFYSHIKRYFDYRLPKTIVNFVASLAYGGECVQNVTKDTQMQPKSPKREGNNLARRK